MFLVSRWLIFSVMTLLNSFISKQMILDYFLSILGKIVKDLRRRKGKLVL